MKEKRLLFIFIVLTGLYACSNNDRKFHIIGNINGMPAQTVVLEQLNADDIITIIDSEKSTSDGHFELSGISPEMGLYRLHFHPNKFVLLTIDKGNIKVTGDWNSIETYSVTGSTPSDELKVFLTAIREHLKDFNTMSVVLDTLKAKGNDSLLAIAKNDFQDRRLHFTQFIEHFADTTNFEPNAVFAARILNPATEKNYIDAFSQSLNRRFPGTKMTRDFGEYCLKTRTREKEMQRPSSSAETGMMAPELTLTSFDGKTVNLSDYHGKYVLVDFWASWCGPCRGENPNVVAAYAKFKDKNFTVLGVSLDNNKDAWGKAIKDDGLSWTQVSDLKGWSSMAAHLYSVHSIPSNFLVDPTGKIVARDLRGSHLEEVLGELLK